MIKDKIRHYITVISSTPLKILIRRIYRKVIDISGDILRNSKIIKESYILQDKTFFKLLKIKGDPDTCAGLLKEKIDKNPFLDSIISKDDKKFIISKLSIKEKNKIIEAAEEVCRHDFDLLGSGKVKVSYFLKPKGVEGYVYDMRVSGEEIKKLKKEISSRVSYFYKDSGASIPGYKNYNYEPIDWHIDFKSGYRWDRNVWYKKLKYGCYDGVDVKNPWELSRFHHLVVLGQAYLITKNEKYEMEYLFQIVDWIISNKPYFGINWRSILDVALRVSNWIVSLSFFRESKIMSKEFLVFILKNIYIHGKHITNNLEYHVITSNHYLSDISSLFLVGEIFSDFNVGKKWSNLAVSELKKEIEKQVYPDGVDFEASTCYHRFVLELFFYPVLFEIKKAKSFYGNNYVEVGEFLFGKNFINKILKMFEFVLFATKPDGELPQIGDNDNGRLFIFGRSNILDMRYLSTLGTIFFKKEKFKIKEYGFDEQALWIFGRKGFEFWNQVSYNCLANIESASFADAGIYIMRKNNNYLISSCSQNGQNGNGGHAHNDKLSFELFIEGESIVVDPGTYFYTAIPEWRNKFRSTSFHSTIMVDNQEQNRFKYDNLFAMENDAKVIVDKWETSNDYDYLEAEHSGYNRLYNSVTHKRKFIFDKRKNYWLIKDILTGKGKHEFDLLLQLSPDVTCEINKGDLAVDIKINGKLLKIIPLFKKGLTLSVKKGWYSRGYGNKTESQVLKYSKTSTLPVEFLFLLCLDNTIPRRERINEIFSKFNIQT